MVGDGCNEVSGNARPLFAKSELGGLGWAWGGLGVLWVMGGGLCGIGGSNLQSYRDIGL